MDHLRSNLAILARSNPELARRLEAEPSESVEILTSVRGLPTARMRHSDGETAWLHSPKDPLEEARALLSRHDIAGADYFVVLGLGLGYVLDAIAEVSWGPEIRVFVVESNLSILRAAFQCRSLEPFLRHPNLRFAWPTAGPAIAEQWARLFDPVSARKSVFIPWPPSVALSRDFYRSAAEVIQSQTTQIFTDINTLVSRSRTFLRNFVQNVPAVSQAPGVADMKGSFRGVPCVIVSAGPSLDVNIHELRGFADGTLILATDTAVKPLLSAGLEPHFICTADPSEVNYRHLEGACAPSSLLVAEGTAHPQALADFRGRLVACTFHKSALHALSRIAGEKGELRAWGSVATMVLDFALLLGCDPVIFIGQDLAYSGGRPYCLGVHFERAWFEGVSDSADWRNRLDALMKPKHLMPMIDVFGREVRTSVTLVSYWNWFLKEIHARPDVRFINATEGGILRDGVEIMSLREALFRFCRERLGLRVRVSRFRADVRGQEQVHDTELLDLLRNRCLQIEAAMQRGLRIAEGTPTGHVKRQLRELEKVKECIYRCREISPLIDSFNQMGNVNFLRGRAELQCLTDGGAEAALNSLYAAYFRSVAVTTGELRSAIETIIQGSRGTRALVATPG